MHKAGRYTAALLLVLVGVFVIVDKSTGSHFTAELVEWWPVLFICLGIEYILFNMKYGSSGAQLKLDVIGIIFAVIISAVVIMSTQTADIFKKMDGFQGFGDVISSFSDGHKYEKGTTEIPISSAIENVKIGDRDGSVTVKSGNVDKVQVELTVYVNLKNEQEASRIADESRIEHSISGNTLDVQAVGKEYSGSIGGRRYPRMDLVITMPAQQKVNLELLTKNGKISAAQLPIKQKLKAETSNGSIDIEELEGELQFETTNGSISSSKTSGPISLKTSNGRIAVTDHRGDAVLKSTNGELKLKGISGNVEARTTNGSIKVEGDVQKLKVETTNGSLEAESKAVAGDWDVKTSNGKIELKLPSHGDYRVEADGGSGGVKTSLPLTVDKKTIRGTVGNGKYTVKAETNGSISIDSSD